MMHNWFECKIRYSKLMESGMSKNVTEPYLVDALSHAEAEGRIVEEMIPFADGVFEVTGVRRAGYSEIFFNDNPSADKWYKVKMAFVTIDEKSGTEKKTSTNVLVQSSDLRQAIRDLDEGMKGSMCDYVIASVTETAIMDVYLYEAPADAKSEFEGV